MKVKYLKSFEKDIDNIQNKKIKEQLYNVIQNLKIINNPSEIVNIKKLSKGRIYYRIRIAQYRLGLSIEGDLITLIRFLHRKDIYNKFP